MRVRELMSTPAFTCHPDDSLEYAARLMWEHDCGILPVVDADGRVQATITDRDICMGAYTRGARLTDATVSGAMSKRAITCRPDDDLSAAARTMAGAAVRRLPVVDAEGRVRGVLSLNDIALAAEKNTAAAADAMKVLIAACRHGISSPGSRASGSQTATPAATPRPPSSQAAAQA
jgi:CBS domain-containing protein